MSYSGGIYTPTADIQAQQAYARTGDFVLPGGGTLQTASLSQLKSLYSTILSHPSNYDSNREQFQPSFSQISAQIAKLSPALSETVNRNLPLPVATPDTTLTPAVGNTTTTTTTTTTPANTSNAGKVAIVIGLLAGFLLLASARKKKR